MNIELIFILGFIVLLVAIPMMMSAYLNGRSPRYSIIIALIGMGLVGYAVKQRPNSFQLEKLPDVFLGAYAQYIG